MTNNSHFYFPNIFLKFVLTMLGLLCFLSWCLKCLFGKSLSVGCVVKLVALTSKAWSMMVVMLGGVSSSFTGVEIITMGAMCIFLILPEIPISRIQVCTSPLCQEHRLPSSGLRSLLFGESFLVRKRGFRPVQAARGLLSSKLWVLKNEASICLK